MASIVDYKLGVKITSPRPRKAGGDLIIDNFVTIADLLEGIQGGYVTIATPQTITGTKTVNDLRIPDTQINHILVPTANNGKIVDSGVSVNDLATLEYVNSKVADLSGSIEDISDTGILTINNVEANTARNFSISGSGDVVVTPTTNGIQISLYEAPSASLSNNVGTVEQGTTVTSVTLNWSYGGTEISQSLNQGIGSLPVGDRSYVHTDSFTTNRTYTLTIDDGTSVSTPSTSINFRQKFHWGTDSSSSLNSSGILSLNNNEFRTNRNKEFEIDGNGEYLYVAYPEDFGAAQFRVNGLLNTAWTESIVSHTNLSGFTENYRVYRSNTIQNGSNIQVEVF